MTHPVEISFARQIEDLDSCTGRIAVLVNGAGRPLAGERSPSFAPLAARQVAAELLSQATFPLTVFASADLLAGALLDEAEARGLRVGEELRVIGFDDQPWAERRGLTTLHQPVESIGHEAASLLLSRLGGYKGPVRAKKFVPHLMIRTSA